MMEIQPATLDQIRIARNGKWVVIDNDVGNVAKDLRTLHPSLRLRHSESSGHFVVYQEIVHPNGKVEQHLVTTAKECDQRLVKRVAQIMQPEYDFAKELDKMDDEAKKRSEKEFEEQIEDHADRLAFAIRKDMGFKSDISRSAKSWGKGKKLKGIAGY